MIANAIAQSVTRRIPLKAYLSSDHVSAATGKTLAVVLSKNGAAFANPSAGATNATEIGNGWYYVDLSTTDTATQGPIIVRATASGVDDVETNGQVVDAHNGGFDGVPSAAAAATGGIPTVDVNNAVKVQSGTGPNQISLSSGTVTVGTNSDKTGYALTVTPPTAVQVRQEMDSNSTKLVYLDATTSSRSTYSGGAVASVTAPVTVGANNDKTGYSLSSSGVQAIWDALTSAFTTLGSVGKLLVTNLDAAVSGCSTYAGGDTSGTTTLLSRLTGTRAGNLDNLDDTMSSRSTYAGGPVASVTAAVTVGTNNDKTGYSLSVAPPTAVQIRTDLDLNSTKLANLDVATSTRSSHTAADVWAVTTRTLSSFGTLVSDVSAAVWGAASRTLSAFGFPVTASSVTDKTGYSLTSAYDPAKTASQAGDAMALTVAYDAAKTALPASSYTAPDNSSITAIKAKTDNLPATPAAVADIPTAIQNADTLLKRDWTSVTGEAARSVLNALRFIRNKWSITGSTVTVTKEDDVTSAWTAAISTNASQDPVSGADPT